MSWIEILVGLLLAAYGLARDVLAGGPPSVGLKQFMLALAGVVLAADGIVRLRSRERRGLVPQLAAAGPGGDAVMFGLAAGVLALTLFAFQHYVVDDAYITFRYAKNALETGHVVWNPGERPVEGYSNFLWMVLAMGALAAKWDPLVVSRAVSIACLVASSAFVYRLARRETDGRMAPRIAVLVFLSIPSFAFWAMSGLETISIVLLVLAWLDRLGADFRARRLPWRSALVGLLLVLSRPEAPYVLGLTVLPILWAPRERGERLRVVMLVALVAAMAAPYLYWKYEHFGTLVANTLSAKAHPLVGLKLVLECYRFVFPFVPLAALSLVRGGSLFERQVWALLAGLALAGLNVEPHVAHYLRFFLPALGGVAVMAGVYGERLVMTLEGDVPRRAAHTAVVLALAAYLLHPIFEMRTYAENEARGYEHAHKPVGRLLAAAFGGSNVLAASDCGLVPYLSGMRTIDIWGLTDRRIATRGFDRGYVMAQHPDVVVVHSMWPNEFRGREPYDEAMYEAVKADPRLQLRGRWGFFGYWLWVYSSRPLATGAPEGAKPPIFD